MTPQQAINRKPEGAVAEAYLLGQVHYEACLALQQRLVYDISGRNDGQIALVVCEHPPLVTIGREGSRAHIRWDDQELAGRKLALRWVNRGGGCLLHLPGQLAIYPIVPLFWHRFTVGDYLRRLQRGILNTLIGLNIVVQTRPDRHDVWGRSGQLAALGVAVKGWTSYHGAYLNVTPSMPLFEGIDSDPGGHTAMSSLSIERHEPVRMSQVRESLVRHLADAFGCQRYHVYTGHPLLRSNDGFARVG